MRTTSVPGTTLTVRWRRALRIRRSRGSTSAPRISVAAPPTSPWPTRGPGAASMPATRPEGCGNPTTEASHGSRSSTTLRPPASEISPWRHRIRTFSGSAPVSPISSARRCPGSVSTSPPTAAGRSPTWGLRILRPSAASSSTRPLRIPSTSPHQVTNGPTTRTAASSRQPTEGAHGRRSSIAARTPAPSTW